MHSEPLILALPAAAPSPNIGGMAIVNEPPDSAGVRINWQLIILACGLSLTLAIAGAAGMLRPAGVHAPAAPPRSAVRPAATPPSVHTVHRSVRTPVLTFVLLDSREDANTLRATINAYALDDDNLADEYEWTDLVVLESEADEDAFWRTLQRTTGDLEAAGTEMRIVDLRD